jgi:hypothetical protein
MKTPLLRLLCLVSLSLGAARAADSTLQSIMTEAGAPLTTDSFASAVPKAWRAAKGTWTVANGVLQGTEVKADAHAAAIRRPLAFTDGVIRFSFRLGQARQISLSINDAKGHVCRVTLNARGFTVQKDDHDKTGPDKALVFARVEMPLKADEWHTAVVELNGPEMVAQVDDSRHVGFGSHELLKGAKTNVGLVVSGGPAEFRDISIAAAKPRGDWAATKQRLAAK